MGTRGRLADLRLIYYLVTRAHAYTVAAFVQGWGKALAGRILVAPYDALLAGNALPQRGTYTFSDPDRLAPEERAYLTLMTTLPLARPAST